MKRLTLTAAFALAFSAHAAYFTTLPAQLTTGGASNASANANNATGQSSATNAGNAQNITIEGAQATHFRQAAPPVYAPSVSSAGGGYHCPGSGFSVGLAVPGGGLSGGSAGGGGVECTRLYLMDKMKERVNVQNPSTLVYAKAWDALACMFPDVKTAYTAVGLECPQAAEQERQKPTIGTINSLGQVVQ